ncbi:hypothetical protein [Spongiactinospora sp. 9N601]|uniref:hypothetical protein n=1 Tax=Spongiactinospora sp. 9N601 TaxID=3375149 RepID=UPI00379BB1CD
MVEVLDLRKGAPERLAARMLVVADTDRLATAQPELQQVLGSRMVRSVLVVAMGPDLRLPPALYGETRRVLWVGDPRGIVWGAETGEAASGPGASAEPVLLDLLTQPELFDAVAGALREIPYGTASPGWRIVAGRVDPATLAQVFREVAEVFAAPQQAGPIGSGPPGAIALPVLTGAAELPAAPGDALVAGGRMEGLYQRAAARIDAAERALGALRYFSPAPARAAVLDRVMAAGQALAEFRDAIVRLFQEIDPAEEDTADKLAEHGIKYTVPAGMDDREIVAELRAEVETALAERRSPGRLIARLLALADQSAPIGSAAFILDPGQICPDVLLDVLHEPERFPERPLERWIFWRRSMLRWRTALALGPARVALEGLRAKLGAVAVSEWRLGRARAHASDSARTLADALGELAERVAGTLRRWNTQETALRGAAPVLAEEVVVRLRDRAGRLREIITGDLHDAVGRWLEPAWISLEQGVYREVRDGLADRVEETLRQYRHHLAHRGVQERPDFATGDTGRQDLIDAVWRQSQQVDRALRAPSGGPMLQLCGDRDLALLLHQAHAVRFAPRAVRGGNAPPGVVWTESGQYAGTLRLVPLRPGAVDDGV